MNMRMVLQLLVPGMEDAEEADSSAEALRIACDLDQRGGAGFEQQVVDDSLVLQSERRQFVRQREHDVRIWRGQQLLSSGIHPAVPGIGLAARAMPVSARVIGDGPVTAGRAFIEMSAEGGCATALNGGEHFQMKTIQPVPVIINEVVTCKPNHLGHLQR